MLKKTCPMLFFYEKSQRLMPVCTGPKLGKFCLVPDTTYELYLGLFIGEALTYPHTAMI